MSSPEVRIEFQPADSPSEFVQVDFAFPDHRSQVYFRANSADLLPSLDAFVPLVLLPCMRQGIPFAGPGSLSKRLSTALPQIQTIYHCWDNSLSEIDLQHLEVQTRLPASRRRVGIFFSGGVDSFYSLIKHQDEITDLILVHGFDIGLHQTALRNSVSTMVQQISQEFGMNCLEIETDLRSYTEFHRLDWGNWAFGPSFASIAQLLCGTFEKIYFAAGYTFANLVPWGSHPMLDPLWSTERLELIHDGCEAKRIDKVRVIAKSQVALRTVRVCWENSAGKYNCGKCEKCLRTMISLKAAGALDKCTTFDRTLRPRDFRQINNTSHTVLTYLDENIDALKDSPADQALVQVLLKVSRRLHRSAAVKTYLRKFHPDSFAFLKRIVNKCRYA